MRFFVGSDHAGISLRNAVARHLDGLGFAVTEIGPAAGEKADYPDTALVVAEAVAVGQAIIEGDRDSLGVLVCGTGIGMSIAANKVRGIRAALVHDPMTARLAREHNDANVLCLGARLLAQEYAVALVDVWLGARFESRHRDRIDKIASIENTPNASRNGHG